MDKIGRTRVPIKRSAAVNSNNGCYHDNGQQKIINGDQVRLLVEVMSLEELLITLQG